VSSALIEVDVAIVGGGLTGLVLAALVKDSGLSVALIEARPPEAPSRNAELDLRISALAPASQALLQRLGVWQQVPADRVCAYDRMCVWQAEGSAGTERSISFAAAEMGEAELGYIVENRTLRQLLWQQLEEATAVQLLTGGQPEALTETPGRCELVFADGAAVHTRLLVGADGGRSWVRQQLDVAWQERAYGQSGLVAHIMPERPHEFTAWQRFLPDGPVALLPLSDGRCSLVWSCPETEANRLREIAPEEFAAELTAATDGVLGSLRCDSPRAAFPLAMGYASTYTGRRFALLGDAAHRVHPLAGQGANLGLLDAAALAQCLKEHQKLPFADPGDPLVLRRYERQRKGDNLITMRMMDALQRVFSSPAGALAGSGMQMVDRFRPLKNRLARYAMGRGRDLPAAAQPFVD